MVAERHIMLDIETLSVRPTAHITEIAYAEFDPYTAHDGVIGEIKHITPCYDGVFAPLTGTIDLEIVRWHLERGHVLPDTGMGTSPTWLCRRFAEDLAPAHGAEVVLVWSKSPAFDEVILRELFRRCERLAEWPIHYRSSRDVRTICALAGVDVSKETKHKHVVHDDIVNQVRAVQRAHEILGITGPVEATIDAFDH